MCSAEGEKAAEGSRIYWLNFTVINGSFTSDIKKMICSLPRRRRSVNLFCVLPAVTALALNKVAFNRLQLCFWINIVHGIDDEGKVFKGMRTVKTSGATCIVSEQCVCPPQAPCEQPAFTFLYVVRALFTICLICFVKTLDFCWGAEDGLQGDLQKKNHLWRKGPTQRDHCLRRAVLLKQYISLTKPPQGFNVFPHTAALWKIQLYCTQRELTV